MRKGGEERREENDGEGVKDAEKRGDRKGKARGGRKTQIDEEK